MNKLGKEEENWAHNKGKEISKKIHHSSIHNGGGYVCVCGPCFPLNQTEKKSFILCLFVVDRRVKMK